MKHSEKRLTTADGIDIYTQTWSSDDSSDKANVVIVHGYLEHCGRYGHVGEYLVKCGFRVTAFDCRGHGKSTGVKGYVKSYDEYSNDLELVLEHVLNESPLHTFVLAHSNGGLIALNHYMGKEQPIAQTRIHGLVITSPFLGPADELPNAKIWASKLLGTLTPKLSLPVEEVSAEILMHDPEMQEAHRKDELNLSKFTLGWAKASMAAQKKVTGATAKTLDMPVLFLFAGDDKVADPKKNKVFGEQLSGDDITVIEKEGEYHELLNETNRKVTLETIGKWMVDHY